MTTYIILIIILFHLSIIDMRKNYVPDGYVFVICGLGLFINGFINLMSSLTLLVLGSFFATFYSTWRRKKLLGWGDVKLMTVSGLWLPLEIIPQYLMLAGGVGILLALLWHWYYNEKKFPFAPALALSLLMSLICV